MTILNTLNDPTIALKACPFCGSTEIKIVCDSQPWLKKLACKCGCSLGTENHHTDGWADRLIEQWDKRDGE